ncbi:Serine/threonine-protein kinase LMTK1 [Aix galericulata]|nr:Serine/threonine-protein kinase LMTK1 [Aix galericulata]
MGLGLARWCLPPDGAGQGAGSCRCQQEQGFGKAGGDLGPPGWCMGCHCHHGVSALCPSVRSLPSPGPELGAQQRWEPASNGTPLSELSWSSSLAVVAVSFSGLFTFIFLMLACLCCKKGDIGFKVSRGGGGIRGGQGEARLLCSPRASPRAQHHRGPYPDPAPHGAGMLQGSASPRVIS